MKLLALETSTRFLSVALWRDGDVTVRSRELANGGSELLLPWVRELLAESGLALAEMDAIAYGSGPGGFTGLRLACGVAQGLAFGADLPVIGVCSLAALALESGAARAYACMDARMNEVYTAAYEMSDGVPVEKLAPAVSPPGAAPLPEGSGWTACGDGFASYPELLKGRLGDHVAVVLDGKAPTAAAVAHLAVPRLMRGESTDAASAMPLYVRDKIAFTTAERLARGGSK